MQEWVLLIHIVAYIPSLGGAGQARTLASPSSYSCRASKVFRNKNCGKQSASFRSFCQNKSLASRTQNLKSQPHYSTVECIHSPRSQDIGTTLRPKYMPYSYMDPLGLPGSLQQPAPRHDSVAGRSAGLSQVQEFRSCWVP